MSNWYEEKIEEQVRSLTKYLRNNGINTEASCGHEMYIQCQYAPDGEVRDIHSLIFTFLAENKKKIDFDILIEHKVRDGHSHKD